MSKMKHKFLTFLNSIIIRLFSYNLIHSTYTLDSEIDVWKAIRKKGLKPSIIFDIGAARGSWTKSIINIFPESNFVLFDPLQENVKFLNEIKSKYPNVAYHVCALGEKNSELELNVHSDQTSKFESEWGGTKRIVPVCTLDSFVNKSENKSIYFMKVDVQGAELDVFNGATEILKLCSVIQVEVSFRKVYKNAPIAHEIIKYLGDKGFRIFDFVSAVKRKEDRVLLQVDMFFVSDNSLFMPETWK